MSAAASQAQALHRFANDDLRAARTSGQIMVAQTKLGTLILRATQIAPRIWRYTLHTCGIGSRELAAGPAASVRAALVDNYAVAA